MFIFRLIGIQLGNFFMLFLQFQIASFCFPSFLPELPFIAFCDEAFEAEKLWNRKKSNQQRYSDSLTMEKKGEGIADKLKLFWHLQFHQCAWLSFAGIFSLIIADLNFN